MCAATSLPSVSESSDEDEDDDDDDDKDDEDEDEDVEDELEDDDDVVDVLDSLLLAIIFNASGSSLIALSPISRRGGSGRIPDVVTTVFPRCNGVAAGDARIGREVCLASYDSGNGDGAKDSGRGSLGALKCFLCFLECLRPWLELLDLPLSDSLSEPGTESDSVSDAVPESASVLRRGCIREACDSESSRAG